MKHHKYSQERACGMKEKSRMEDALRCCEFSTDSIDELRSCYSRTAKQSGQRARHCISSNEVGGISAIHF